MITISNTYLTACWEVSELKHEKENNGAWPQRYGQAAYVYIVYIKVFSH